MARRTTSPLQVAVMLLAGAWALAVPGVRAVWAQTSPLPTCALAGVVHAGGVPLPGVAVTAQSGTGEPLTTSTDAAGRWNLAALSSPVSLTFALRGFTTVDSPRAIALRCGDTLETAMHVAPPSPAPGASPPPSNPPSIPLSLAGTATLRSVRQPSLDRASLRERAAAIARGEFSVDQSPWPERLIAGAPGVTSAPLLGGARAGGAAFAGPPPPVAARIPRLPTIAARQLYSATGSYTVAGSALDSTPFQLRADTRQPKPDYLRQSVDVSVGGPLALPGASNLSRAPNVTLSYSSIRGGNLFDQYATVPTADMRDGQLSTFGLPVRDPLTGLPFDGLRIPEERITPAAQLLLSLLPLPNGDGSVRNFHYTSTNRSTQDSVDLRLTHALAGPVPQPARGGRGARAPASGQALSATVNGRVEYRRNINDRLSAIPAIAGIGASSTLRVPVSLNVNRRATQHSLSMSYNRNTNATTNRYAGTFDVAGTAGIRGASADPFTWGIPTLSFASMTSVTDLTPATRTDERLSAEYAWSHQIRSHRIRVGGEAGQSRSAARTDQNARGAFVFTGIYSGSDFGDFLLGYPQRASVQYGPGVVHLSGRTLSLYAQDDWRRWSNVTINAGLRYELVTPFREDAGRLANLDVAPDFSAVAPVLAGSAGAYTGQFPAALVRTDVNNVAPRIGAAWQVASRTTLRAGYGVSFNTGSYAGLARQLAGQPPFAVTNTALGTPGEPLVLTQSLLGGEATTTNTFGVARDYEAGTVHTWTLDLARDMGDAWNVSAGLTRAVGSNLDIVRAPNRGADGLLLDGVQPFLWQTSEGGSRLRSATVRVRRWYVRGFSTSVNYTLARAMDNASTIGGGATVVAQDERDLEAEWGVSSFNRPHRLSGDVNFELPFGENHRWLNRGGPWAVLLGRWSAYITFSLQSGTPLTPRVLSSTADVARGTNGTLRADLTGHPIPLDRPSAERFFNTGAFTLPAPGAFGNAGRNIIRGPGSRDLNLQVTRDVDVGGRTLSVQVRAQNVLNLVNFASVDTVVNSPTFGQVLSVRPLRSVQVNVRWRL